LDDHSNLEKEGKIECIELLIQLKFLNLKHESVLKKNLRSNGLNRGTTTPNFSIHQFIGDH